jgi:hypothetical protein
MEVWKRDKYDGDKLNLTPMGLLKKSKSINHKGGRALKNSPVGYFSEGARLQGRYYTKVTKV